MKEINKPLFFPFSEMELDEELEEASGGCKECRYLLYFSKFMDMVAA